MRSNSPRGETLIETMVSLAVMAVGILGILQMNGLASDQSGLARRETLSAQVARDLVDAFERLPYDHPLFTGSGVSVGSSFVDLTNTTGLHRIDEVNAADRPLLGAAAAVVSADVGAGTLDIAWRVSDEDPVKKIAVMVGYPGPRGSRRQVTLWTTKANLTAVVGGSRGIVPEL